MDDTSTVAKRIAVTIEVNGTACSRQVEPRTTLVDFLRDELGLTGTHVGCEHGVCGACTVRVGGRPTRSCLMFAVQADGEEIETVEGLAGDTGLTPLQRALHEAHALQCGFCTPGILIAAGDLLERRPDATRTEIKAMLSGHLCRCTGYKPIVDAIELVARERS
jgi:aerobic-type carbon monoxide dehydrogenase small subunit (CoxS/CutS family)